MTIPAYSPHDFLRQADNKLIARYIEKKGVPIPAGLDIASLKQTQIDPVVEIIQNLNLPVLKEEVDTDFRQVTMFATKAHIQLLFEVLQERGIAIPEFEKQKGYIDKALWVLNEYPDIFREVLSFSFPYTFKRHWQTFPHIPGTEAHITEETKQKLAQSISAYFQKHQGRGKHCIVEHHPFRNKEYLFAYPSDYSKTAIEYTLNGHLDRRNQQPAFMVVFVFQGGGEAVDVYVEEQIEVTRAMVQIFAKEILGLDFIETKRKQSFNVELFRVAEPTITIPAESPVLSIAVWRLQFASSFRQGIGIDIRADISQNKRALYEELQARRWGISYVKSVGLEATLQDKEGKQYTRRFEMSGKTCNLRHDGEDGMLRQFLKDTQIDITK